jgi:hypothetical protein
MPTPTPIELTQGSILKGIKLDYYGGTAQCGFILTARCDLSHPKTQLLHLLPIVRLKDWLGFDGLLATLRGRVSTIEGKVRDTLAKLAPGQLDLLTAFPWPELATKVWSKHERLASSQLATLATERDSVLVELGRLHTLQDAVYALTDSRIKNLHEKRRGDFVTRLTKNEVADAHLLPELPDFREPGVVLLRAVTALPMALRSHLEQGVLAESLPAALKTAAEQALVLEEDDPPGIASVQVASPHVELILQRFSSVFGRIGVEDYPERYCGELRTKMEEG